jgi:hypothetical protein
MAKKSVKKLYYISLVKKSNTSSLAKLSDLFMSQLLPYLRNVRRILQGSTRLGSHATLFLEKQNDAAKSKLLNTVSMSF